MQNILFLKKKKKKKNRNKCLLWSLDIVMLSWSLMILLHWNLFISGFIKIILGIRLFKGGPQKYCIQTNI